MSALDFSCSSPMKMIDANTVLSGDVSERLETYSAEANLELMVQSYATVSFLRDVPREAVEWDAAFAESFFCARRSRATRR